jgi:hypothetical protein
MFTPGDCVRVNSIFEFNLGLHCVPLSTYCARIGGVTFAKDALDFDCLLDNGEVGNEFDVGA